MKGEGGRGLPLQIPKGIPINLMILLASIPISTINISIKQTRGEQRKYRGFDVDCGFFMELRLIQAPRDSAWNVEHFCLLPSIHITGNTGE